MKRRMLLSVVVAALFTLAACSSQQLYGSGQAWKRNQCQRMPDTRERERCLDSTAATYEEYQRQREEVRRAP